MRNWLDFWSWIRNGERNRTRDGYPCFISDRNSGDRVLVRPEFRGQGLGIQLLGRAVLYFRALGRDGLRLHVSEDNAPALAFYRKHGFENIGMKKGILTDLFLMEKEL